MNRTASHGLSSGRSKIIEIVGPAGAGKSTLYRALQGSPECIHLGNFPDVRKWVAAPFYISNGIQLIPKLRRLSRSESRCLTKREFAWLSILHGWSDLLREESLHNGRAIVLDQGPVYLLAELLLFGPEYLRRSSAESLWQGLYERWSATLDMVIWLDAADDILLERIRTRQQDLVVKDRPAAEVYEYLDSYRTKYDQLLSILTAHKKALKIRCFNTGTLHTQNIVNELLSVLSHEKS